jgi:LacI family transcriptional regulator
VRPALVERVLKSARQLDYPKRLPELHRGITRIEVLMARPDLTFTARLSASFERMAASLDPSIVVHRTFVDEGDPRAIAAHINSTKLRRSALIIELPDHPLVTEAVHKVASAGLPVVQTVTGLQGLNAPFVGIDNEAAGRMAGLLMSGMVRKPGHVVAMCHSGHYRVHRDRVRGFSQFLAGPRAAHLSFHQAAFTYDDAQVAAHVAAGLLASVPDLVGIYSAGGDYDPLCALLKQTGRAGGICLIGHELNDQSKQALEEGTMAAIIDQAPETQARRALDLVLHRLGLLKQAVDHSPIRFITITPECL